MTRSLLAVVVALAVPAAAAAAQRPAPAPAPLVPREIVPAATEDNAWVCPANGGDECADSTGLRWFNVEESGTAPEWWMAGAQNIQGSSMPVGLCRVPFGVEGTGVPSALLIGLTDYQQCVVGVQGRVVTARNYEVLIGGDEGTPEEDPLPYVRWVAARGGALPRTALRAGNLNGQPLAICRVRVGTDHRLGYAGARTRGCVTTVNGRSTTMAAYQVLVDPRRRR